ncbi:YncE family protein [Aquimarina sediminis]|uniref:YncE family protein n=1 Tax=Aquimarina sediminis TaxID=2070536 RepID=UPI000CA01698|nr:YncE family protein [Aquimarina sediminis]
MSFTSKQISFLCFLYCSLLFQQNVEAQEGYHKSVVKEGIKIDFSLSHLHSGKPINEFREGDHVLFQFKISDTITGKPLSGSFPAAWMDKTNKNKPVDCGRKIVSFIEGALLSRPELDLNVYYVLTLNDDNTINVVDPLFGFGGSQLLTQIQIPGTGYDWAIKENQTMVYVSMPKANQVALINTSEMKNEANISIPGQPKEIVLQPDEHYLWVSYDLSGKFEANSGVAVIDTEKKVLIKTIQTGSGSHNIVAGKDNDYIYVTNQNSQTISVIDVQSLEKVKDISIRDIPVSIAYSEKANALYVVNKKSSIISVIDRTTLQVIEEINGKKGIDKITFAPDGRLGFVLNPLANTISIIDSATNRIIQSADVDEQPDEVSFSDELAYVRHLGSEIIWMIPLDVIGKEGAEIPLIDFTGGQNPPALGAAKNGASGIIQAPGANAVLVSNYLDKSIYYYSEGMAAPSGHFSTYGKHPKAVQVIDKSIEETAPGVYQTTAQLRTPGDYEISLFLDVPSFMECFAVNVLPNKEKEKKRLKEILGPISIHYLSSNNHAKVGTDVPVKFELLDVKTSKQVSELKDVKIMTMNSAGRGYHSIAVKESEIKGVYKTNLKFEEEGLHYIYVECLSRGLTFNNPQFMALYAYE